MAKVYFPSWRYHKELGEKIVRNPEEDQALGPGWVGSPADFDVEVPPAPPVPVPGEAPVTPEPEIPVTPEPLPQASEIEAPAAPPAPPVGKSRKKSKGSHF